MVRKLKAEEMETTCENYKNLKHVSPLKEQCLSLSPAKPQGCTVSTCTMLPAAVVHIPKILDWPLEMERVQTSRGNSSQTHGPLY